MAYDLKWQETCALVFVLKSKKFYAFYLKTNIVMKEKGKEEEYVLHGNAWNLITQLYFKQKNDCKNHL